MGVYTDARYTRIRYIDVKPITSRPAYVADYALKGLKYGFADIDYLLILPRIQGTHIDQEQRRASLHLIPEATSSASAGPATHRFSRAGLMKSIAVRSWVGMTYMPGRSETWVTKPGPAARVVV